MKVPTNSPRRPSVLGLAVMLAGLAVVLAGCLAARDVVSPKTISPGPIASPASSSSPDAEQGSAGSSPRSAPERTSAPNPVGVRIPTIAVMAETIPLDLRADGSIEVPEDYDQTGWWADGPEPGEPGAAVILGHVDSVDGPAVFSRLGDLSIGDVVHVDREDGTSVSYQVDRIEQHPKDHFPTDAVYGRDGDESVLRLVTCGGRFDRDARSYVDNVIVFTSMVGSSPAATARQ